MLKHSTKMGMHYCT